MQNQIDITTIKDLVQLKALAYDQLSVLEGAKNNLGLIYKQMEVVSKAESDKKPDEVKE